MSDLEEVGRTALDEILKTEFRGVLVDFWSPWCGPCRPLRRQLAALAEEHEARWRFVAVNTEAHPEAAEAFGVRGLPTVALFRRAAELHRFSGGVLPSDVDAKLAELA